MKVINSSIIALNQKTKLKMKLRFPSSSLQVNRFKVDKENKVKKIMDKVKIKNKTKVEETFYTLDSTINHEELTNNN